MRTQETPVRKAADEREWPPVTPSMPQASHAKVALAGAVITITADHPSWSDAWVVRRPAHCGNVDGADAAVRQQVRAFGMNAERRRPCPSSGGS